MRFFTEPSNVCFYLYFRTTCIYHLEGNRTVDVTKAIREEVEARENLKSGSAPSSQGHDGCEPSPSS